LLGLVFASPISIKSPRRASLNTSESELFLKLIPYLWNTGVLVGLDAPILLTLIIGAGSSPSTMATGPAVPPAVGEPPVPGFQMLLFLPVLVVLKSKTVF
jgi:hypothetical protein